MTTNEVGVEDDPSIDDEEVLYRKVPLKPDFYTVDYASGRVLPHISSLRYEKDGLSVLLHTELVCQAAPEEICDSERTAFGFRSRVVREAEGRVKRDPQPQELHGEAHALAGTAAPPPDRQRWSLVRKKIIEEASWVMEPPRSKLA